MNMKFNFSENKFAYTVFLIFILIIIRSEYNEYKINNSPVKYGVGCITGYFIGKTTPRFYFKYSVNSIEYKSEEWVEGKFSGIGAAGLSKQIGKCFIVKFSIDNPSLSDLLILEEPYSKCMGKQPDEGWEEFPKCTE